MEFYLGEIKRLNPHLHGVIEVNPDVLHEADKADHERIKAKSPVSHSILHGIPILVKDNIATKDKTNTTAGSFALLGSIVPRDSGVVTKLRKAGAIILGKASMTEWAAFKSSNVPNGWSARGGQGVVSLKLINIIQNNILEVDFDFSYWILIFFLMIKCLVACRIHMIHPLRHVGRAVDRLYQ